MKKILFLTEKNIDVDDFDFINSNLRVQVEWNTFTNNQKYDAIFVLVETKIEVSRILEKYKFQENNKPPFILIYTRGKFDDFVIENNQFNSIISIEIFKELFPKNSLIEHDGIFFKVKNRLEKILFREIIWIQAKDIYAIIKTKEARFLVSNTLGEIDERLKPFKSFQRIHRSYIVNLSRIEAIEDRNALVSGEYLPIGQAYRDGLFSKLLFI